MAAVHARLISILHDKNCSTGISAIYLFSFQGDSGGPLTVEDAEDRHTLVGVVSHGLSVTCGQPGADIHMKVPFFIQWINATIVREGGMASCNYMLTAKPTGENTKETKSYGVLMTGGKDSGSNSIASVEFLGPGACPVPALPEPRSGHVTFVTAGGAVTTCGGWLQSGGSEPQTDCLVLVKETQAWMQGIMGDLVLNQHLATCPTTVNLVMCIFPYIKGIFFSSSPYILKVTRRFLVPGEEFYTTCDGLDRCPTQLEPDGSGITWAKCNPALCPMLNVSNHIGISSGSSSGSGSGKGTGYCEERDCGSRSRSGSNSDSDSDGGSGSNSAIEMKKKNPPTGFLYSSVSMSEGVYVMYYLATSFLKVNNSDWVAGPPLPLTLQCAVQISPDRFLVVGGEDRRVVREYNTKNKVGPTSFHGWVPPFTWPSLERGRYSPACQVFGDKVVIGGGWEAPTVETIHLVTKAVARGLDMMQPRYHFQMATFGEEGYMRLLALGGELSSGVEWWNEESSYWQEAAVKLRAERSLAGAVSVTPDMVCTPNCKHDKCQVNGKIRYPY